MSAKRIEVREPIPSSELTITAAASWRPNMAR